MSNLTDFFPSGGGGLTPKFEEFNASGTFTPSQALIDAGGYVEVFLVGGGGGGYDATNIGGQGGEVLIKKTYLTSTTNVSITIGSGGLNGNGGQSGSSSSFIGSTAGGDDIISVGGAGAGGYTSMINASWNGRAASSSGSGVLGYGVCGGSDAGINGVGTPKINSGQGGPRSTAGASCYCLIKWYE